MNRFYGVKVYMLYAYDPFLLPSMTSRKTAIHDFGRYN